jgi:maltooligosyltrehalose synthase
MVVVVPRLPTRLVDPTADDIAMHWGDTAIPLPGNGSAWFNVFSGTVVDTGADALQASSLLGQFPVALLVDSPDKM